MKSTTCGCERRLFAAAAAAAAAELFAFFFFLLFFCQQKGNFTSSEAFIALVCIIFNENKRFYEIGEFGAALI